MLQCKYASSTVYYSPDIQQYTPLTIVDSMHSNSTNFIREDTCILGSQALPYSLKQLSYLVPGYLGEKYRLFNTIAYRRPATWTTPPTTKAESESIPCKKMEWKPRFIIREFFNSILARQADDSPDQGKLPYHIVRFLENSVAPTPNGFQYGASIYSWKCLAKLGFSRSLKYLFPEANTAYVFSGVQ